MAVCGCSSSVTPCSLWCYLSSRTQSLLTVLFMGQPARRRPFYCCLCEAAETVEALALRNPRAAACLANAWCLAWDGRIFAQRLGGRNQTGCFALSSTVHKLGLGREGSLWQPWSINVARWKDSWVLLVSALQAGAMSVLAPTVWHLTSFSLFVIVFLCTGCRARWQRRDEKWRNSRTRSQSWWRRRKNWRGLVTAFIFFFIDFFHPRRERKKKETWKLTFFSLSQSGLGFKMSL